MGYAKKLFGEHILPYFCEIHDGRINYLQADFTWHVSLNLCENKSINNNNNKEEVFLFQGKDHIEN